MKIIRVIKLSFYTFIFASSVSCQSNPANEIHYEKAAVVDRMDGFDKTPPWTNAAQPMIEKDGTVFFIQSLSMSGDGRPEACTKAAEESGRASILRYVKENISVAGQLKESDASSDPGVETYVTFLSQGKLSGVRTDAKYWEPKPSASRCLT